MSVAALKGWSRVLVTSTVLALNTFLNLGLATSTPNGTVAAAFTNVQAQETDTQGDSVDVIITAVDATPNLAHVAKLTCCVHLGLRHSRR